MKIALTQEKGMTAIIRGNGGEEKRRWGGRGVGRQDNTHPR